MRRKIPSTAALTVFEAAARHQSYTKAADELAVTHSAVSRQIAGLEEFLGVNLFQRSCRGVTLTESGRAYALQVRSRLDEVERDARDLMARGAQGGTLELAVVPTFATRWLLPRLADFHTQHPGIQIHLTARTRPLLFEGTPFDAAIHAGRSAWPGTEGVLLMGEQLLPVASPRLLGRRRRFTLSDWQRHTLLQQSTRPMPGATGSVRMACGWRAMATDRAWSCFPCRWRQHSRAWGWHWCRPFSFSKNWPAACWWP